MENISEAKGGEVLESAYEVLIGGVVVAVFPRDSIEEKLNEWEDVVWKKSYL